MIFRDRIEAGERLAEALSAWRGRRPLVVVIPRGAVPMGKLVADRLAGDFDIVLTRKLHAPWDPEFAVGAVDEAGWTYVSDDAAPSGASPEYLRQQAAAELATMRQRRALYTPGRAPLDAAGRVVIVVDDGLATGATMIAALHALRAKRPQWLVCAAPVASRQAVANVRPYADEVVCVHVPGDFHAVGQYYGEFPQVSDAQVVALLRALPASTTP